MDERAAHSVERLSRYLDGDLGEADRVAVERHLAECGACRDALVELKRIVSRAGTLPEASPPHDLWPGIAAAISGPISASGATVIPLPTAGPVGGPTPGVYLTRAQLAAAAVIVMLISVSATLLAGPGLSGRPPLEVAVGAAPPAAVMPASETAGAPAGLADEVGALAAALEQARSRLDPETVRVLEKNLAVIDRAIDDSRRALAVDRANPFLEDHLARAWERKRDYLKEAARLVEWAG